MTIRTKQESLKRLLDGTLARELTDLKLEVHRIFNGLIARRIEDWAARPVYVVILDWLHDVKL